MPIIEVTGFGTVELPDGMSREEMEEALSRLPQSPAQKRKEIIVEAAKPELPFLKDVPFGSMALGTIKPLAGAAEWLGIKEPARKIKEVSEALKESGGAPAEVAELAGEVMSPIPTKAIALTGKGLKAIPKVGEKLEDIYKGSSLLRGTTMGATAAALNPLGLPEDKTYGDFLEDKLTQMSEAGALGGALGKTGQMIMNPKVSAELARLKQMGVKYLTPGQLMSDFPLIGKALQTGERYATSTPLAGAIIERGLTASHGDFNRALGNKVLAHMGEELPKNVSAGPRMIEYINERIENAYDKITPKLGFQNIIYPASGKSTIKMFTDELKRITAGMTDDDAELIRKEFRKTFLDRLDPKLGMTGEQFREAEKNLGRKAYAYMRNPEKFDVGLGLRDLQAELRRELAYQNPKLSKELRGIHDAFISHLPVERAASMVGAEGRVFSPSQLQSAIKAVDRSKNKSAFASGKVPLYQEMEDAMKVLGKNVPDSGTAQRLSTGLGLVSLPLTAKALIPPTVASALLYNRPALGALTTLATERPQALRSVSDIVEGALSRSAGFGITPPEQIQGGLSQ